MNYNNGSPIHGVLSMPEVMADMAKDFSEGSKTLEELLLTLWNYKIETYSCCKGGHSAEHLYNGEANIPFVLINLDKSDVELFKCLLLSFVADGSFNVEIEKDDLNKNSKLPVGNLYISPNVKDSSKCSSEEAESFLIKMLQLTQSSIENYKTLKSSSEFLKVLKPQFTEENLEFVTAALNLVDIDFENLTPYNSASLEYCFNIKGAKVSFKDYNDIRFTTDEEVHMFRDGDGDSFKLSDRMFYSFYSTNYTLKDGKVVTITDEEAENLNFEPEEDLLYFDLSDKEKFELLSDLHKESIKKKQQGMTF